MPTFPFEAMIAFGFLSLFLVIGVFLRANIKFFQHFLIPSALIGGIIGLILMMSKIIPVSSSMYETFAYHFFNVSFISLGLAGGNDAGEKRGKEILRGTFWMSLIEGISFSIQGITGGVLVILFGLLGIKLFPTFGFFAPLALEEGPGQSLSIGKVWEGFGFDHAATIGLSFATLGILLSLFIGVPLVNWGVRKGLAVHAPKELPQDLLKGIISKGGRKESAGELTMHSGNIETLAFQLSMIGVVYLITYGIIKLFGLILSTDVESSLWGFFFIIGILVAVTVQTIMKKFGIHYLVDSGIQQRITGWSVDYMIASTVMAVQMVIIWKYIVPILTIVLISTFLTTIIVVYLGNRLWSYNLERMVSIYGTVIGIVPTGLLLLRIADPEFRTPAALELGLCNIMGAPFIFLGVIITYAPLWWNWSVGFTVLVYAILLIIYLYALHLFHLMGKSVLTEANSVTN